MTCPVSAWIQSFYELDKPTLWEYQEHVSATNLQVYMYEGMYICSCVCIASISQSALGIF